MDDKSVRVLDESLTDEQYAELARGYAEMFRRWNDPAYWPNPIAGERCEPSDVARFIKEMEGLKGGVLDVSEAKLLPMGFIWEVEVDLDRPWACSGCPFAADDIQSGCILKGWGEIPEDDCPLSRGAVLVKRKEASDV